jgi:hypothetical protein
MTYGLHADRNAPQQALRDQPGEPMRRRAALMPQPAKLPRIEREAV